MLAALVLASSLTLGGFGAWVQVLGGDGRWLMLAAAFGTSLVFGLSRRRDGSHRWNARTVFVVFAGGLIGLALVAVQPDTYMIVLVGITGVSLVTQRRRLDRRCPVCARALPGDTAPCCRVEVGDPTAIDLN